MYKGANRNMQRAGIKTTAGVATGPSGQEPLLPTNDQARMAEAHRLARVRRSFEIQQEISRRLANGESVAELRAELEGISTGRIEVPLALARDPKPHDGPAVTVAGKRGPERGEVSNPLAKEAMREYRSKESKRRDRLSPRAAEIDLNELAKGKVTLTNSALVRTMAETFDFELIADVLGAERKFLKKLMDGAAFALASPLSAEDGLVLVDVLERRMKAKYPSAAPTGSCDDG